MPAAFSPPQCGRYGLKALALSSSACVAAGSWLWAPLEPWPSPTSTSSRTALSSPRRRTGLAPPLLAPLALALLALLLLCGGARLRLARLALLALALLVRGRDRVAAAAVAEDLHGLLPGRAVDPVDRGDADRTDH